MASKLTVGDLQVVAQIPVFRGLRPETVGHIVALATATLYRPREVIIRQDEISTAFFIVIDGWVKHYRSSPSGEDAVINVVKKGASFGEAVALTGTRCLATAEAVSDARVVRIPADHLLHCIRENPDLAVAMIASTTQRIDGMMLQIEQLKAQSGVQRVAEFLASLSAVERGACTIVLPYDKVLIASRLGLTPEYLSRAFARLRSVGVSVNASKVVVQDIAKLRQLAGEDRGAVRETCRPPS